MLLQALHVEIEMKNLNLQVTSLVCSNGFHIKKGVGTPFPRIFTCGESRIIFLPERSSICQYRPETSAIIVKTQSRARLVLAHPVLYIVKTQKNVMYNHFKINQKAL